MYARETHYLYRPTPASDSGGGSSLQWWEVAPVGSPMNFRLPQATLPTPEKFSNEEFPASDYA